MNGSRLSAYGAIAAVCIVLNFAIMMAGEAGGVHYVVSTTVSFVLCVLVGYALHSRYTFSIPTGIIGLTRYTMAMAMNFPLSIVTIWFFHDLLGQPMFASAPASTLTAAAYNFFSSRWAIAGRKLAQP